MSEGTSGVIDEKSGTDASATIDEGEQRPGVVGLGVALIALAIAASVSCVFEAAYLFARTPEFGSGMTLPLPISAVVAAVLNTWMVSVARRWSPKLIVQAFPLAVWLLTLVCLHLGPGGNMPVPPSGRGLLLLLGGLAVPVFWGQIRSFKRLAAAT